MWIFTSMGRPHLIRRVVDSYDWSDNSRVILALYRGDARLSEYLSQKWPGGWQVKIVDVRGNGPTYNDIFERYPHESCYGFLADDAILDTPGMLTELEVQAGDWNISYANDQHWGVALPTMPCIGGELARSVGFLSPPSITHWAIDNAWGLIGEKLGCLRYREELKYTHLNPFFGTAPDDSTYQASRRASVDWERIFWSWTVNDLPGIIERVKLARLEATCSA